MLSTEEDDRVRTDSEKMTKEKKASTNTQQRMYPVGTMLAVDLYANGNFFEAVLKKYRTDKKDRDVQWAHMHYLDGNNTKGWIDLNVIQVVELSQEKLFTLDGIDNLKDNDKGFLERRLTVQWSDGSRYHGMITKILKNNMNFVFISYDDGDKCWYNLSPKSEKSCRTDAPRSSTNNTNSKNSCRSNNTTTSKSARIKKESLDNEGSTSNKKSNNGKNNGKQQENKISELEKKYPIGSTIAVDIYHDEHYHEAVVKKYLNGASKKQQARGEQWVYLHFTDKGKTKQWIDLNCIKAIKITPEKTRSLADVKPEEDEGFLGKRIVLEWSDGNKYCGLATRSVKDDKYFVFLEYDDGDQCWCDLQRESEWRIKDDDDDDDVFDDDDDTEEGKPKAHPKRKARAEATEQATKKTRPAEESFDS